MQYIDIHIKGQFLARVPLGSFDLMTIQSGNWQEDALERARLVEMMLNQFSQEPLLKKADLKNPEFYLVFESRMNEPEKYTELKNYCDGSKTKRKNKAKNNQAQD